MQRAPNPFRGPDCAGFSGVLEDRCRHGGADPTRSVGLPEGLDHRVAERAEGAITRGPVVAVEAVDVEDDDRNRLQVAPSRGDPLLHEHAEELLVE